MALSLPELDRTRREALFDENGQSFQDFRRGLKPNYARVWFDIGAGYVVLAALVGAIVAVDQLAPRAFVLTAVVGGLGIGYVLAFLQLFFHEAAHFNLARTRANNDLLANLALGLITGQNIKAYRVVHMDHHRLLGTPADTENSYFNALNSVFLLESLSGIRLLRVLSARSSHVAEKKANEAARAAKAARGMLLLGLGFNLVLLGFCAWARCWSLLLAWPFGMIIVLPAITSIRQLLEHRSYDAKSETDYATEPHGAVTRMFGRGPIASTLGGAGFNRHLLHHWDPQLSYTNFAALEAFLLRTEAAPVIRNATTTYARAFLLLIKAP
jgi:fatty acid desaturase